MHSDNWDDLRFVLAVADAGSVAAAARTLGVNHATVLRRIASFETRHSIEIFEKSHSGYTVPADRIRLLDAAREVESAMRSVERMMTHGRAPLSGLVRVTSSDTFCVAVLPRMVDAMTRQARALRIEILSTNAHLDFQRLHADITLRPTYQLPDELSGEIAGECGFAVYAAPGARAGWLGLSGPLARSGAADWMQTHAADADIVAQADSFLVLRELVAQGQGRGILPCVLGDEDGRMVRLDGYDMPRIPLWIASHVDLRESPRLLRVRRAMAAALQEQAARIRG